jgi:hypothetical protein
MSELFAVQLTAVATLALAVLALATAVLAGLAFLKQSREVGLLLEQNQRDIDDRRRAQASRVFLSVTRDDNAGTLPNPYVRNASDMPVYEARIWPGTGTATGEEIENLETILPGETIPATRWLTAGAAARFTILTFRDAAGRYWKRYPNGHLVELSAQPTSGTEHTA